jgi:putative flippase GtrA
MRKLFSYGAVGVVGSAIYIFCTIFLTETVGITPIISSGLAYTASFSISFFANHHFVFRSKESVLKTGIRFTLVSAFGFFLTTSIIYLTVEIFKIPYLYGVAAVLIIIPLSNFLLNLRWTFRDTQRQMTTYKFSRIFNLQKKAMFWRH